MSLTSRSFPALLSVVVPFFVYLLTLAPTVVFFDAGELITSSFLLAPGHPPGYPLFVTLGKFAAFFPFGSVAYKLNLMAAAFSALAALAVFLITSKLLEGLSSKGGTEAYKGIISFLTALTFAFSYNNWNQAIISEVYPINTFLTGLLIYILLIWRDRVGSRKSEGKKMRSLEDEKNLSTPQLLNLSTSISQQRPTPNTRLIYLVSFILGVGIGNHHTLVVTIPVLLLVVTLTNWRLLFDAKAWGISTALFFLGISVYLLMPLRALQNPELNWADPDTISKFKWAFLREGYPKGGIYRPWSLFWQQLKTFDIVYEFSGVGLAIGCLGITANLRKRFMEALVTATVILVLSIGIIIYGNPIAENVFLIESFHTPSYMIFSVWIGAGLFSILNIIYRFAGKLVEARRGVVIISLLMAILPASLCAYFYPWNDRSGDYIAYDYAQNELASMPSNSILFTWGDSGAFPLWYVQMIERYHDGILLIHTPHLSTKWYVDELPDTVRLGQLQWIRADDLFAETALRIMLRENFGKYPLYIDYSTRYSVPIEGYTSIPRGLIYKLATDTMEMTDITLFSKYAMRGIYEKNPYRDLDTGKAVAIYANTLFDSGSHLLKTRFTDEAYTRFEEAVRINPGMRQQVRDIMFGGERMPEGHP